MEGCDESESLLPSTASTFSFKAQNFKLEPALLFVFFGWYLSSAIIPNQLLKQTCLVHGYSPEECTELVSNNGKKEIEEEIQPHVAKILTIIGLLNTVVPGVLSLFLGPWSDKFGRKKVICATFLGYSLASISLSLISSITDNNAKISPYIYMLPYILIISTGGWPTMILSVLCYITDLSNDTTRSTRLTIIECLTFLGSFMGMASSSFVLKATSPTTVFTISAICVSTATVCTVGFVSESLKVSPNKSARGQLEELVSPAPLISLLKTCFKPRAFNGRKILWCLIFAVTMCLFTTYGTYNLYYLFVREKFQWTLKEATLFDSTSSLISVLGSVCGLVIFKKILGLSDVSLAIVAITSALADSLVKVTAQSPTQIYFAPVVGVLKNLQIPMCRSIISTVIPRNEIGKIFSFISSFEAVATLFAAPLYTFVYTKTFTVFAGAFYLITGLICVTNLILIFNVKILKMKYEILVAHYAQNNNFQDSL